MNIGDAAKACNGSAKMRRHDNHVGLFPQVLRTDSCHRQYGDKEVSTLRFIRQCRQCPSPQVKALAHRVHCGHGDDWAECPIFDVLAESHGAAPTLVQTASHARTAGLSAGDPAERRTSSHWA